VAAAGRRERGGPLAVRFDAAFTGHGRVAGGTVAGQRAEDITLGDARAGGANAPGGHLDAMGRRAVTAQDEARKGARRARAPHDAALPAEPRAL
jgi:hypothetical protein